MCIDGKMKLKPLVLDENYERARMAEAWVFLVWTGQAEGTVVPASPGVRSPLREPARPWGGGGPPCPEDSL